MYIGVMAELRDYLQRRRAEAVDELQPLQSAAADLRSKLAAKDARICILTEEISDIDKALAAIGKSEKTTASVTIKEAVLQVLSDAPNGMTSSELLEAINDRFFDGKLERTSMSPQLSRLRVWDKKIVHRGDKYFLA
jgi:hypothetical protein